MHKVMIAIGLAVGILGLSVCNSNAFAYEGDFEEYREDLKDEYESGCVGILVGDPQRSVYIPEGASMAETFDILMRFLGYEKGADGEYRPPQIDIYSVIGVDAGSSDYDKILAAYKYLIMHQEYYSDQFNFQGLWDNCYVCEDYATDFYKMLQMMGIDCEVVVGITDGGSHAWNRVLIGDEYRYFDVTWDDVFDETFGFDLKYCKYFNISYEQMEQDHTAYATERPPMDL